MPKDCKSCEAPVDDGASHVGAGDCRAAQRKEIRRLRTENDGLRGQIAEERKMQPRAEMAFGHNASSMSVTNTRINWRKKVRDEWIAAHR